jgi:hypothetical protein
VVITLLGVRKFRRGRCGRLDQVPRELVQLMARHIYSSNLDIAWSRSVLYTQWSRANMH